MGTSRPPISSILILDQTVTIIEPTPAAVWLTVYDSDSRPHLALKSENDLYHD
jgi:hypothetical protein